MAIIILKKIFNNLPKYARYISPDLQNEIINTKNSFIVKKIVTKINQAKCFIILADESYRCNWDKILCMLILSANFHQHFICFAMK